MAGSAGSIYVDVLLRSTGFDQGIGRATQGTRNFARNAESELSRARQSFLSVVNPVNNLGVALGGLGASIAGALSIRSLVDYSDRWKQIEGRLSLVTQSTEQLRQVQQGLADVAERTRQPLEGVANFYSRLVQFVPEAERAQYDFLGVTESVASALAITGETSAAAQGAMIQFTQAIGTNFEAAGQELRSLQEQAPRLTQALMRALGDGTKSLQTLKDEGLLTRQSVLNALSSMGEEGRRLREELLKIPPTTRQAFTQLSNSFLTYIGLSGEAQAATNALAQSVRFLADNLGLVLNTALIGVAAVGARALSTGLGRVGESIGGFVKSTIEASNANKSLRASLTSLTADQNAVRWAQNIQTANLNAANATIAQTRANIAHIQSLRGAVPVTGLLTAETTALATAERARSLALKELAILGIQNTRILNAQAVASAQLAAASNGATGAMLFLNRAGSLLGKTFASLYALVGGKLGIAILAIGGAVYYLSNQQTLATKINQEYGGTFDEVSKKALEAEYAIEKQSGTIGSATLEMANYGVKIREATSELAKLREEIDQQNAWKNFNRDLDEHIELLDKTRNTLRTGFIRDYIGDWEALKLVVSSPIQLAALEVELQRIGKLLADGSIDVEEYEKQLLKFVNNKPDLSGHVSEILKLANGYRDLQAALSSASGKFIPPASSVFLNGNNSNGTPRNTPGGLSQDEIDAFLRVNKNGLKGLTDTEVKLNDLREKGAELVRRGIIQQHELDNLIRINSPKQTKQARERVDQIDKFITKQSEALLTLKQEAEFIGLTTIEIDKLRDAREFEAQVAERALSLKPAELEAFRQQTEAIKQLRQEAIQTNYELSRSASTGAADFFKTYVEEATNNAENVKSVLETAFKSAEDAFVEFTRTGKLNFKDFADSLIQDIIRIQFRQAAAGIIGQIDGTGISSIGNFINTVLTGSTSVAGGSTSSTVALGPSQIDLDALPKYATGGYIGPGKFGIAGEAGAELIFGGKTGATVIPQSGSGSSGLTVNIINNTPSQVSTRQGSNGASIEVLIDQAVATNMARSGSQTNQALRNQSSQGLVRR